MKGFTTRAVHGALSKKDVHGSLRMPVYDSVAFEHESARSIQLAFEGKRPGHTYSRISNPTVEEFEQKIRLLSGSLAVMAVASGMAAISNTIFTLAETGTNIVTTRNLFGNTLSLFTKTFLPWGLAIRNVAMTDPREVETAIDSGTRAVFLETITNPQLEIADCLQLAEITQKHDIPLIVDNTVMTPYLFDSKAAGVNIELLSGTKYISGGATSVSGIIIDNGNFDWNKSPKLAKNSSRFGRMTFIATLRQEVFRNLGPCLSPHNAYLQSLGLETMALRIDKSCQNAQTLAEFLAKHPAVVGVNYPGLADSSWHQTAASQFGKQFGGLLTFDMKSQEACFGLIDRLQLIRRATNINDNKSLILHPWSTIFAEYSDEEKERMGVRPTMIRLSAGIEDIDDLLDDIKQGVE